MDLTLFEYSPPQLYAGYSSGGFLANTVVRGTVAAGSQQQWLTRNSEIGQGWQEAVWNMCFLGVEGAPDAHCGQPNPYVVQDMADIRCNQTSAVG